MRSTRFKQKGRHRRIWVNATIPIDLLVSYARDRYASRDASRRGRLLSQLGKNFTNEGLVLFIGAGVSASLGLPTWNHLLGQLTTTAMGRLANAWKGSRWSRWSNASKPEIRRRLGTNQSPIVSGRFISFLNGESLADAVSHALYWTEPFFSYAENYRERNQRISPQSRFPNLPTSELIEALILLCANKTSSIGVKAIVNYNFDDVLDEHLRTAGLDFQTIASSEDQVGAPLRPCYHVHGVLPFRDFCKHGGTTSTRRLVFSEDEYHAEYANSFSWSNLVQTTLLCSATGLFIGHSLTDPNIRRLIDLCHKQRPHTSHYAILKRSRPLAKSSKRKREDFVNFFEEVDHALYSQIGIQVIWVDEFEEIPDILVSIAKAKETHRSPFRVAVTQKGTPKRASVRAGRATPSVTPKWSPWSVNCVARGRRAVNAHCGKFRLSLPLVGISTNAGG
jgi:hypothetical protein